MAKKYDYDVLGQRIIAHVLDNIIETAAGVLVFFALYLGFLFIFLAASGFKGINLPEPLILLVMIFVIVFTVCLVIFLNSMYLVHKKGASVGKMIVGLSIIDAKGKNLGYGAAFVRELIKNIVLLFSIFGAVFYLIVMLKSKKKQGPADHVIHSYVVEKKAVKKKKKRK
jgi:uncharacterized RDD family membrane protein YckC